MDVRIVTTTHGDYTLILELSQVTLYINVMIDHRYSRIQWMKQCLTLSIHPYLSPGGISTPSGHPLIWQVIGARGGEKGRMNASYGEIDAEIVITWISTSLWKRVITRSDATPKCITHLDWHRYRGTWWCSMTRRGCTNCNHGSWRPHIYTISIR